MLCILMMIIEKEELFVSYGIVKGYTTWDGLRGQFFRIFEIKCFCFAVAICNLEHDVKAIHGIF